MPAEIVARVAAKSACGRGDFARMLSLMAEPPPVALTIAGSDNSAGAGAQADLKTFGALGVYGLTAITCVVAEVPGKVSAIQPVDPPHRCANKFASVSMHFPSRR